MFHQIKNNKIYKTPVQDWSKFKEPEKLPSIWIFLLSNRAETAWNNKNAPLMIVITSSNCDKTDMEFSYHFSFRSTPSITFKIKFSSVPRLFVLYISIYFHICYIFLYTQTSHLNKYLCTLKIQ